MFFKKVFPMFEPWQTQGGCNVSMATSCRGHMELAHVLEAIVNSSRVESHLGFHLHPGQ